MGPGRCAPILFYGPGVRDLRWSDVTQRASVSHPTRVFHRVGESFYPDEETEQQCRERSYKPDPRIRGELLDLMILRGPIREPGDPADLGSYAPLKPFWGWK